MSPFFVWIRLRKTVWLRKPTPLYALHEEDLVCTYMSLCIGREVIYTQMYGRVRALKSPLLMPAFTIIFQVGLESGLESGVLQQIHVCAYKPSLLACHTIGPHTIVSGTMSLSVYRSNTG